MACDKGLIPWDGKCLTPAEAIKAATTMKNGSTAAKADNKATDKKGFDWVAVLAILAGAAPAVIAATKGQKQDSAYSNSAYQGNETGGNGNVPKADSASIPVWVWAIAGVVIAVVLYVILRPKQ